MELLLLLLGGLAAGAGLWAVLGGRGGGREAPPPPPLGSGTIGAPRSSPELPEPHGPEEAPGGKPGEPVLIGGKTPSLSGYQEKLEEALKKAPPDIQDRVRESLRKAAGPGVPGKTPSRRGALPELLYTTDDIIPPGSRFAHHRRSLQNAENLVKHNKIPEAMELLERIKNRIKDEEIREKIQKNLDRLRDWSEGLTGEAEEPPQGYPEIVVPLTVQAIAIENLAEGLKNISEGLVSQLSHVMAVPVMVPYPGPLPQPPAGGAPFQPAGATGGAFLQPPRGTGEAVPSGFPAYRGGGAPFAGKNEMPEGLVVNESGDVVTDGWTDSDFEKEWEKYKNLPLKDRRSGSDRRSEADARWGPDNIWKDRRGGEDRRQRDLFQERDDFLKKLDRHKKNKQLLDDLNRQPGAEPPPPGRPLAPPPSVEVFFPEEETIRIEAAHIRTPGEERIFAEKPEEEEPAISLSGTPLEVTEILEEAEEGAEREPPTLTLQAEEARPELPPMEILPEAREHIPEPEPREPIGLPPARDHVPEEEEIPEELLPEEEIPEEAGEALPPELSPPTMEEQEGVEMADELPELGGEEEEKKPPIQEIRGVLELKPPEEDDAPFLTLTYDFTKIPDSFKLSQDYHTMEYVYYKYKPMLIKAQEFTRRKMLKNALNYYRVIKSQNIPPEFKRMVNRNIQDITEYLQKYLMSRG